MTYDIKSKIFTYRLCMYINIKSPCFRLVTLKQTCVNSWVLRTWATCRTNIFFFQLLVCNIVSYFLRLLLFSRLNLEKQKCWFSSFFLFGSIGMIPLVRVCVSLVFTERSGLKKRTFRLMMNFIITTCEIKPDLLWVIIII